MEALHKEAPSEVLLNAVRNVCAAASLFNELLEHPESRATNHDLIRQCKKDACACRIRVLSVLRHKSFLWRDYGPAEKLIRRISRIPSLIERAAARLMIYGTGRPSEDILRLGECIMKAAGVVLNAMEAYLRDDDAGLSRCVSRIRAIIDGADAIGAEGSSKLPRKGQNAVEAIKEHDIVRLLGMIISLFRDMRGLEAAS